MRERERESEREERDIFLRAAEIVENDITPDWELTVYVPIPSFQGVHVLSGR